MDSSRDVEPVTTLERNAADLIARARERRIPIVITQNGRATAVLQDVESFERQRRALALLKLLSQGEADAESGHTVSHEEGAARVRGRLRQR